MKINKRLIYKTLFTLIGIIILAVGGFMAYLMIPSGFQSRQAEGPKVLTELLKMAEESQPFNPDPYISSTYRPGDPLYEPVLAIQRDRWDIAKKLLQPLVEQGNADAMYWLAHISGGSIYAGEEIARLFRKSAELGNPYAALRLDVSSEDCSLYLRGYCDPKWGKLGRKLLQEQAAQGDKKAEYYLLQYDENSSEEVHKELERLVTENAKNHYYQPLMRLIYDYTSRSYLPFLEKNEPLSLENKKLIIKLSKLAANNNFLPLVNNTIYSNVDLISHSYMSKLVKHTIYNYSNLYVCRNYYSDIDNSDRDNIIMGAACSIVDDTLQNETDNMTIYNYSINNNNIKPLTKDELTKAQSIAEEIIKNMTPAIYIDEMNTRP
ncbi:tetratricopeptide repeat protein [Vibrio gazogenes]|uniref:Sel1 repeat family protein n=1 Tax=Vibrio gazogenes TaxID=687 RepID=A0A1Z2SER2_VIBGA|nr:hypothetical protein [Vibrio gazogenes]ASA55645.1 hypothetical protein BSQ33_07995 [Vibrio gazogenes]